MKKEVKKSIFNLPILDCVLFAVRYCADDKEKDLNFLGDSWCGVLAFKVRNWEQLLSKLKEQSDIFLENQKLDRLVHFVEEAQGDKVIKKVVYKNSKSTILLNEEDFYLFAKAPPNDVKAPQMECMEVRGVVSGEEKARLVYNFDIKLRLETFVPTCFCEHWDSSIQEELAKLNKSLINVIKEHAESVLTFEAPRRIYGYDASVNVLGAHLSFIEEQITSLNECSHLNAIVDYKVKDCKVVNRL